MFCAKIRLPISRFFVCELQISESVDYSHVEKGLTLKGLRCCFVFCDFLVGFLTTDFSSFWQAYCSETPFRLTLLSVHVFAEILCQCQSLYLVTALLIRLESSGV